MREARLPSCRWSRLDTFVRRGGEWRHDRYGRKESSLALIPRGRLARDHRKGMLCGMWDEACPTELPQSAGLRIEAGEPDPAVSHEPLDLWVVLHDATHAI